MRYGEPADLCALCNGYAFGDERKDLMARAMGVSRSMLSAMLSGHRKTNLDHLLKAKAAFPELDIKATVLALGRKRVRLGKLIIEVDIDDV